MTTHLLHLCGRRDIGDPEAQYATLIAILNSGNLRLSKCPIFWIKQIWMRLNCPQTVLNQEKHVLSAPGVPDDIRRAMAQRTELMVCFADIPWVNVPAHTTEFGTFGVAFEHTGKLGARAAGVRYIDPDQDELPDARNTSA